MHAIIQTAISESLWDLEDVSPELPALSSPEGHACSTANGLRPPLAALSHQGSRTTLFLVFLRTGSLFMSF